MPILTSANVPAVFLITPENVRPVALLSPIVRVGVPLTPSTVPDPERPLMVSLLPFKLSVPLTATFPAVAPLGI